MDAKKLSNKDWLHIIAHINEGYDTGEILGNCWWQLTREGIIIHQYHD